MNDKMLRYSAAAELLGVGVRTLQSMVCRKQVPHYRIGKRLVVFSRVALLDWMDNRRFEPLKGDTATSES